MPTTLILSKNAINEAIMAFEVSWSKETGFSTYNKKYSKPVVPAPDTTDSGVTIGIGCDLSFYSPSMVMTEWGSVLPLDMVKDLQKVAGLKKKAAVNALPLVKNVYIPIEAALQVFYNKTIFKFAKQALSIYPDLPKLHPVEISVIISLVYNRGIALEGDRRKEMKQLITDIKNDSDNDIAKSILAMCRIWPSTQGLVTRRKKEAALIMLPDIPIYENDKLYVTV